MKNKYLTKEQADKRYLKDREGFYILLYSFIISIIVFIIGTFLINSQNCHEETWTNKIIIDESFFETLPVFSENNIVDYICEDNLYMEECYFDRDNFYEKCINKTCLIKHTEEICE